MPGRPGRNRGHGQGVRGFRRDTDLQRWPNTREQRRSILIVTNGNRTEVDYFEALRQENWVTAGKVKPKFEHGDPATIVLRAATIRDEGDYDEAWAVCDVDEFDVKSAIASATANDVRLALSAPCFEVWLILHLSERCPGFNDAAQAGSHLKKLLRTWDKKSLRFEDFRAGVEGAATRAGRLGDPPDANPSSAVWRLVKSLRALRGGRGR